MCLAVSVGRSVTRHVTVCVRSRRRAEALTLHSEKDPLGLSRLRIDLTLIFALINHLSTNSHARMSLSSFKLLRLIILRKGDANGREQWTALVVECEISHSAARARCVIAIEMNRAAREGQVARTHLNRFSVFARILSVT